MAAQPWICGSCRSINQPREGRCYRCRTPRELVEANPETLLVAGAGSKPAAEVRPTGGYRDSGGWAFLAQVLIGAALLVTVVGAVLGADLVGRVLDGDVVAAEASASTVVLLGGLGLLIAGAALVAFAIWLSRVIANVPAAGLGWPNLTPSQAVFETMIPGVNLYRVPAVLRDVVNRLEPNGRGEALIAAAWLGLVGGILLPRVAGWGIVLLVGPLEDFVGLQLLAGQLGLGLTIIGGVFLIGLVQWVEQRMAKAGTATKAVAEAPANAEAVQPAASESAASRVATPAPPDPATAPSLQPSTPPPAPPTVRAASADLTPAAHWTQAIRRPTADTPATQRDGPPTPPPPAAPEG